MSREKLSLATNPIRVAREARNLTLEEFAAKCKVHLQAVYLNESGVYPEILPSIMDYLLSEGLSRKELESQYKRFVTEKRKEFYASFAPYSLPEPRVGDSPIVRWREHLGLSRSALAKGLCVQPSLLSRVEQGKSYSLPQQLVDALKEAEFPIRYITELQERLDEYC